MNGKVSKGDKKVERQNCSAADGLPYGRYSGYSVLRTCLATT